MSRGSKARRKVKRELAFATATHPKRITDLMASVRKLVEEKLNGR